MAYVSDKSGQDEIYMQPYPAGSEEIVSSGGGREAVWGPSGSELFYRHEEALWAVRIDTGDGPSVGAPRPLFEDTFALDNRGSPDYDVFPDGSFVFVERDPRPAPRQINMVLNWFEELKRLVPVN